MLTDLLTVAGIVAIVAPPKLISREAWFELAIVGAVLFGFALQAGRGSIVLPIVVGALGRILYRGFPRFEWLVASGALVVGILAVVFYARTAQHSTFALERVSIPRTFTPSRGSCGRSSLYISQSR